MDSVTQTNVECLPCIKPPGERSTLEDRLVFLLSQAHSLEGDGQAFLTVLPLFYCGASPPGHLDMCRPGSDSDKLDIHVNGRWRF